MNRIDWAVVRRLVNRALAGVNYLLAVAVSVVIIIVAVVLFVSLVDGPSGGEASSATSSTTTTSTAPTSTAGPTTVVVTTAPPPTTEPAAPTCSVPDAEPPEDARVVRVYFGCTIHDMPDGDTWAYRTIPEGEPLIQSTLEALVRGPTDRERADGLRSLFTRATADAVIDSSRRRGAVTVDLRSLGPQPALQGPEGDQFLADLNNTLFQHDVVQTIEYRIEGSCEDFWAYLGEDECLVVEREQWTESEGAAEAV